MPDIDMGDLPEMVSARELAVFLGVSVSLLGKWRHSGVGPPWTKVTDGGPGLVRYPRSALRDYLAERTREASNAPAVSA